MVMGKKAIANKSRQKLLKDTRCPSCHMTRYVSRVERTNTGLVISCDQCGTTIDGRMPHTRHTPTQIDAIDITHAVNPAAVSISSRCRHYDHALCRGKCISRVDNITIIPCQCRCHK